MQIISWISISVNLIVKLYLLWSTDFFSLLFDFSQVLVGLWVIRAVVFCLRWPQNSTVDYHHCKNTTSLQWTPNFWRSFVSRNKLKKHEAFWNSAHITNWKLTHEAENCVIRQQNLYIVVTIICQWAIRFHVKTSREYLSRLIWLSQTLNET